MIRTDAKPLKNQKFQGIVLKDIDPLNQGRYKVWIGELMHQLDKTKGIWCKNKTNNNNHSYTPIQANTDVVVLFTENDFNTGVIIETNHDTQVNSLPAKAKMDDRDKIYNVITTDKDQHAIIMTSGTSSVPGDSVFIYSNNKKAKIILNGDGIHIYSAGDFNISAGSDINISAGGKFNVKSGGDVNLKSGANINADAGGTVNNKGSTVNIDGGAVNLKGGISSSPINGTIAFAGLAGGLGAGSPITPGSAGSAADNSGFATKKPAEI